MDVPKTVYVLPHPRGGWQIRRDHAARASRRTKTYSQALESAARLASRHNASLIAHPSAP